MRSKENYLRACLYDIHRITTVGDNVRGRFPPAWENKNITWDEGPDELKEGRVPDQWVTFHDDCFSQRGMRATAVALDALSAIAWEDVPCSERLRRIRTIGHSEYPLLAFTIRNYLFIFIESKPIWIMRDSMQETEIKHAA